MTCGRTWTIRSPVTDADLEWIGTFARNGGFYPENWRELTARSSAVASTAYAVAPSFAERIGEGIVRLATGGQNSSFIVDPSGRIVAQIPYPGESVTSGVIDIEEVRHRRRNPETISFLAHLRTEAYRSLYADPIYPAELLSETPIVGAEDRRRRDVYECGAMDRLRAPGIRHIP